MLGSVSLAFPADVAALVNRRLKPLGAVGYSLGVFGCLSRLRPLVLSLAVDHEPWRQVATVLLCAQNNCRVAGSMKMAPGARVDDGQGDLVIAGPVSRTELVRTFPKIFGGSHLEHPAVSLCRFQSLELATEGEVDVMVDGESLRLQPQRVEVVADGFDLLL